MKKGGKVTSGDRKRYGRFTETCKPDEPEAYFCYGHFADSTQHRVYAVFKCVFIGFAGISGRKYDSTGYGAAVARIASCPALYRNRCSNVFEYADCPESWRWNRTGDCGLYSQKCRIYEELF